MRTILSVIITIGVLMASDVTDKPKDTSTPVQATTNRHAPRDDKAVIDLWILFYRHQEQNTAYQASMTADQKQMQDNMKALQEKIKEQSAKVCPGEQIDLSNPASIMCVSNPEPPKGK